MDVWFQNCGFLINSTVSYFSDELTEDLSLGLILDDRDDSVIGEGWSDDEEEGEDDFFTPRHLPTLEENESSEDFNLSQRRVASR